MEVDHRKRLDDAVTMLHEGYYLAGFREMEARFHLGDYHYKQSGRPRWDGKADLAGKTIVVKHEQGYGDTIMMLRYVPVLRAMGARVLIHVPSPLIPILPDNDGVIEDAAWATSIIDGEKCWSSGEPPEHDYQTTFGSLPYLLDTTIRTIPRTVPYVKLDHDLADQCRDEFIAAIEPGHRRVGICWQGNPHNKNDHHRSIPLKEFAPLARDCRAQLVSLQVSHGIEQIQDAGFSVLGGCEEFKDFGQTAARIEACDLVVTCCSSVAHLAGALGKPVWIAVSRLLEWRWPFNTIGSHWYPSATVFRQHEHGDWSLCFQRIAETLKANL